MYLSTLTITNFRSCYDTAVTFQGELTLLVGENNSGKSNIIQALQLVTTPLSGRTTRFFEAGDLSAGRAGETVELTAEFADLTDTQKGLYLPALDLNTNMVHYSTRFRVDERGSRFSRPTYHAGPFGGHDPEPEQREKIRHVYLAPLRDAERELNSGDGRRLAQVIEYMFDKEERERFVEEANAQLRLIGDHEVPLAVTRQVQEHLTDLTRPVRAQGVGIQSVDHELRRLARNLRMRMAEEGCDLADLADSGLGYANLLYIATVILELRSARDVELTLFLVEEPEAHLHPQLQSVLLRYLRDQAEESKGRDDASGPAGRIQVVCTTHSPNLASGVGIENVVVLRSVRQSLARPVASGDNTQPDAGSDAPPSSERPNTTAIAIAGLGVPPADMKKISRYLDVTKAALLFARRVMLVEGLAEGIVLPTFVRRLVYPHDTEEHRRLRRDFSAVTLIAVDGIDFAPYVRLLLTPAGNGHSILDKLVIVTDSDPPVPASPATPIMAGDQLGSTIAEGSTATDPDDEDDEGEATEAASNRKAALEELAAQIGAPDRLKVFTSRYTFEADLLLHPQNLPVLRAAYLLQRPRASTKWEQIVTAAEPALEFYIRLRRNSKLIGKGEFAYDIVAAIEADDTFACPDYLALAVREVMADSEATGGT